MRIRGTIRIRLKNLTVPGKKEQEYEQVNCENSIMRNKNRKSVSPANILWMFVMAAMLLAAVTNTAKAKSLYVIADIYGSAAGGKEPVHAYDIGVNGTLTFQTQHDIPSTMLGAVGMAIDSDSGYLFITYEAANVIQVVDGTTMTGVGRVEATDAADLAGIVYDHTKKLLYCVDRGREKMYVYDWDAKTISLTRVTGSPKTLWGMDAYGIALDEIDGLLYVGNASKTVGVYNTSNWQRVRQIELSRVAISVAVDVMNGFLYTGGGYAGNNYLTQYHLATGTETAVQVEPDAGVMGLGVDPDTGLVYMSTGVNNAPGGDNLLVYDTELNRVSKLHIGGNPTGLAIPGKDIGFNPLNLTKELIRGAIDDTAPGEMASVGAGKTITYGIGFSNLSNDFTVTDISIVDVLSRNVTFVSADDDGVGGHYDSKTHTYRWSYADLPPGSSTHLELTVRVDNDVDTGTIISNSVTINSNETAPATAGLDVVATSNSLNLEKSILGAAEGKAAIVEPNELVTYVICFDNSDNDFMVTDILLIDMLAPEMIFVSADNGKASGFYDAKSHTYTWIPRDMAPGASACVGLVARVDPDLRPGTVITNSAIIDSSETSSSMVSVGATISFSALGISKTIVGGTEGQLMLVGANDNIEYLICFENNSDNVITDLTVVDTLPPEVEVVKANPHGQYDPKAHTYTWSHRSLEPNSKSPTCVTLVVQVNKDIPPATLITNSVTITGRETESATASADAITPSEGLVVTKLAIEDVPDDGVEPIEWVDIGDTFTYLVCMENNNDFAITKVRIDDTLPKEVTLVEVRSDDNTLVGVFDPITREYNGLLPSLAAGATTCVRLRVRVREETAVGKIISNSVTVRSDLTIPITPSVDVTAGHPVPVGPDGLGGYLSVTPDLLRDNNSTNDLLATIQLPPGFEKEDIDINRRLRAVFVYQQEGTDYIAPVVLVVVPAKRQQLLEELNPATILATFDRTQVMGALPRLGRWSMVIKGRYNNKGTFRTYRGSTGVFVNRFAGD